VEGNANKKRMGAFHLFEGDARLASALGSSSVIYFSSSACSLIFARGREPTWEHSSRSIYVGSIFSGCLGFQSVAVDSGTPHYP
jgi:hypothetical protein